jgi:hypothetical protein
MNEFDAGKGDEPVKERFKKLNFLKTMFEETILSSHKTKNKECERGKGS